jgi:DNA-binding CsgD family transcriptional regulator
MDLLERDRFLGLLNELYRDAINGQGRIVAISGEAGGGKTTLVGEFTRSLRGRANTFVGTCDPLSTPRPLGPLLDISYRLSPRLDDLVRAGEERFHVFQSFLDALAQDARPRLVVFEDLHWADEATLDLIRFIGRRLDGVRALIAITYREDDLGPGHGLRVVLGDLASSGVVRRIELPPLSVDAVSILAAGSGLDPVQLHRQTGGNPFFVTEVVASGRGSIPATVRDAVLARLARLSPDARAYIEAAAVVGPIGSRGLVSAMCELSEQAESEVDGSGWLRFHADRYSFRHELVRDAVMSALSLARRTDLSRRCLSLLETHEPGPDELATLAHHAENAGDAAAVLRYAPNAARRAAAMGAHREAVAQYRRALRFADQLEPDRHAELLEAYAIECLVTDRSDAGIEARERAIAIWRQIGDRPREAANLNQLATLLVLSGRNAEGERASRQAIDLLWELPSSREHALAFRIQASLRMLDRDSEAAVEWAGKAIELARHFGDDDILIGALNTLGAALIVGGDRRGIDPLEQSLRLARAAGADDSASNAYANLGSALGEQFFLREAQRWLESGIEFSAARDLDASSAYMEAWLAIVLHYQGSWPEGAHLARSVLERSDVATISRIMALIALGRVRARMGGPDAGNVLDSALELALPTGTLQRIGAVRAARAEAAWLTGDRERTLQEAAADYDLATSHRHAWFTGELAYWQWKAGASVDIPEFAAEPYALQMNGEWSAASERWGVLGCPYERARALAESADETALREALTVFDSLGAGPMTARVARMLRELGASNIPRGPRPSTRANPAGLTRRQVEVLGLIAEGLSNAEIADRMFLSPKTVEHHVSAILTKLGARTRAEAAVAAARLELHPQARGSNEAN